MGYFDRFDICEAHLVMEMDHSVGGWLRERPSNRRRRESTGVQLSRMGFKARPGLDGYNSLSENGKNIYFYLCVRYGFPRPDDGSGEIL